MENTYLLFNFESLARTSSKRRHPNVQRGGVPPLLPCTTIFLSDWTSSSCPSSTLYSMIHERNEKLKCPKIWHIFKTPITLKKLKNISSLDRSSRKSWFPSLFCAMHFSISFRSMHHWCGKSIHTCFKTWKGSVKNLFLKVA